VAGFRGLGLCRRWGPRLSCWAGAGDFVGPWGSRKECFFRVSFWLYNLLYLNNLVYSTTLGSNIVIKDVDEAAYRNLRGEAVKAGLKVGEAASQAFRLWVQQRSLGRIRDTEKMRKAAERMDQLRKEIGRVEGWSSTEVIREWRERRKPS